MRLRIAMTSTLIAGVLAVPGVALAQEAPVREPIAGICLRPLVGKILNLPLIDIPDQPIPKEPIALVLGGQFDDCHP